MSVGVVLGETTMEPISSLVRKHRENKRTRKFVLETECFLWPPEPP